MESQFNDKAATILTKDFTYEAAHAAEVYALTKQIGGSLSYKIFINDSLVDEGKPNFGSAGNMPLNPAGFKEGTNTLRVEADPQPEIGAFEERSSCDIALLAANRGAIASTNPSENNGVIARVTCPKFKA